MGREQEATFITEDDLYRLIISSKLPEAQKFEAWVFDEVLPTIRRHGMYASDKLLTDDEFLKHAIATLHAWRWTGSPLPSTASVCTRCAERYPNRTVENRF
ncbi:BRO-N domain-containing protein [Gleimia hominis]|uniref:BRO-N domain-containing protein n=1 Tax=Gleimia hominis TaxID=595468 RepID=UPI0035E457D2